MGNLNSSINKVPLKEESKKGEESKSVNTPEDIIFDKILNISNQLLLEYNNEFLKDDFCSKIAIIYEKKLSKLNIKILKSLYNNINSKEEDNDLLVTLQYLPNDNDKFIDTMDFFNETLKENFWEKKIEFNSDKLENNDMKISKENIESYVKYLPNYIKFKHVNSLLNSVKSNPTQNGGVIEEHESNTLNSYFNSINNNKSNKPNKEHISNINSKKTFPKESMQKSNSEKTFPKESMQKSNSERTFPKESMQKINSEKTFPNESMQKSNSQRTFPNESMQNKNSQRTFLKESMQKNNSEQNKNSERTFPRESIQNNNSERNFQKESMQNKNSERNFQKESMQNNNSNQNKNSERTFPKEQIENTNILLSNITREKKELTEKIENQIENINQLRKNIISKKETIKEFDSKDINKKIDEIINTDTKYYVPKKYKEPFSYCNKEKCELTKKELCIAITENFIVRNNIIAAILTTIPYKNENNEYEGGICYQKFKNFLDCNVCVPYDYRTLNNEDINKIIQKILEKADFLDENRCKLNQGFFFKLSDKEKKLLFEKSKIATNENIKINPTLKYNLLFVQYIEKLKTSYFSSLNSLITILQKIQEIPVINNKNLNIISNETKNIIDTMYNMCHYYYIYGIISLINSDIKEETFREDKLESIVSKAILK